VRRLVRRRLVPAVLRTIDNRRLSDTDMRKLIDDIASGRRPEAD
jgi:hypothetical protein